MQDITLTWENANVPSEIRERVQKCFEDNHLNCKITQTGLYITCDDEKNAFSYIWWCMMELAKHVWFRNVVQSCVWTDGYEAEDVIISSRELIAKGEMDLYE